MDFDFGPISRTVDASTGKGDAINFASLPVHEALTALLAATNRDEFVAWLWHDLFKPLFWWRWNASKNRFEWIHYPNNKANDPLNVERHWSAFTRIPSGLVETHHYTRGRRLVFGETETVNNEFDQVTIGRNARFIQLTFLSESATNTALLRAVIADAFMEVVTKTVAEAIERELTTKQPTLRQVRYIFDFEQAQVSTQPAGQEIELLSNRYDMLIQDDELVIQHFTPVISSDLDGRYVEVVIDFTDAPPTPEELAEGIITLVELLTIYQDSRTILMGISQFLPINVGQLTQQVKYAAEQRLRNLDVRTLASKTELEKQARVRGRVDWATLLLERQGQDVDLLAHVLAEQVEIRIIDPGGRGMRPLSQIVSRPIELLRNKSRHCRFCNTAFDSAFPLADARMGAYFTDIEHVGFGGDICPMCRVYVLNSHKSRTAAEKAQGLTSDRKGYRGALAFIAPSSHFTYTEDQCTLVERPPLDIGGRFDSPLQRATVTLQEYALFNTLSRRIIARIWTQLDAANKTRPLPLPYLGAILLTQNEAAQIRILFDCLEVLFDKVELLAYPFRVTVQPAVELAFEMAVSDLQKHHTKHTYLKTSPLIVAVDHQSKFTLLVDNGLQLEVSKEFFEDRKQLRELLGGIGGLKRQHNWLLAVLQGEDPVTAAAEAYYDRSPFWQAERVFWDTQLSAASPAEQWQQYEEVRDEVKRIVAKYPMLIEFFAKP